jgi:exodeoxyribonuclease V alpha subunit
VEVLLPVFRRRSLQRGRSRQGRPWRCPQLQASGLPGSPPVPAVYLPPFYQAERGLAGALLRLHAAREDRLAAFSSVDWDTAFGWLHSRTGTSLAPEQAEAVRLALTSRVAVLTGGPGCGKSFTVRSVVELARAKGARVILVAPTGRAAKRLAELTGHEAATVHRLLQLRPGGDASFDASSPLDADLVVVDESSMVDVILANKLVKAIPPGAHLLLVGDVDQLPSVGAGEVLRDLLAARTLPVVRLTKIFRQAQESGIVVNAQRINSGEAPELRDFGGFFWFTNDDTEETARLVVDIVSRRIPAKFGLDPRRDVQVLCPMRGGPSGAGNLNLLLQEALTPYRDGQPERRYGGRVFRIGDRGPCPDTCPDVLVSHRQTMAGLAWYCQREASQVPWNGVAERRSGHQWGIEYAGNVLLQNFVPPTVTDPRCRVPSVVKQASLAAPGLSAGHTPSSRSCQPSLRGSR